ncbi:putative ribonuclease H-like domain-containing protein, partial [Tanacetum coccineum]
MIMQQYICHTDHNLWDVIVNGDLKEEAAPLREQSAPPAPKTAKQLATKRNQERVNSILLLAIPDEYLLKFHNVPDAKSLWAAIKSRFRGNEESKKMQKNVLKHQFENFTTVSNESLDKAYDRFQKLISQLEVHGAPVSKEDINQKFLRKSMSEMKGLKFQSKFSQNLAFLSSENTSSTNEVSTASGNFGVNTAGGNSSSNQVSSTPGADEVIDQDDLEELDIRQQVAMLTVRVQRFVKKTGRNLDFKGKQPVTFDKSKVECYNCHRKGHFAKECKSGRNQGKRSNDDNGRRNMPNTNEPSSPSMVQNCFKQCLESFKTLQKNYDSEREKHNRARLEIQGYELALESLESRILGHEKNELTWGEKYDQMSAHDKNGLGYGTQLNEMSDKSETDSEISMSVFEVRSSDEESTLANDRFSKADGYHAIPPPITGNFLTPRVDISFAGLDEYAIRKKIIKSKTTELNADTSKSKTSETVDERMMCLKLVVKTNETQTAKTQVDKIGQTSKKAGIGFKKKRLPLVVKLVWDNAKRVNHQNFSNKLNYPQARKTFVPLGVLTRSGLVNPVRPNEKSSTNLINTARPVSTARSVSTARPFAPKTAQTSSAVRPIYPRMDNGNPESCLQDHAVVDSGCSSHMTGNKAYLSDYEDYNRGFVAFGSDPKGDKHNMVAFLKKPNESVGFTEIVDFLKGTSLRYALTHNPTIYDSLVKQFWQTATVRTLANGTPELVASIDNKEYTITEASVRSKLQLADAAGISNLPDAEIYDGLATLGYVSEGKLTFWKKNFTPQWKFLIHTILHCLSPKSGGWDQFGSPIATALICLSSNRVYNFSKLIFDGMVHNIESNTKFLMYPRFLQMILGITTENNGKYLALTLTKKLFANMKRGYAGDYVPLLPALLAGAAEDQADEATTTCVRVGTEGATTTTSGLDAGLDSGNIHESPLRIANLEKELHQTKTTYGKAVLTVVERVKSLEVALKRKTKKVVVESMKEQDTDFVTPIKISALGEVQEQDISPTTLEAAKTLSHVISLKEKSTDKGIRYKRKTRLKSIEKDISTNLDVGIEVNTGNKDF